MADEQSSGPRVLFDVQHPAQVHLFKHALWELQADGHETLVTSRDKEVTVELLDALGIDHRPLSSRGSGLASAVVELGVREYRTYAVARSFQPDVVVSRVSPPAVHAASLVGARSVVVTDTDVDSTLLGRTVHAITLPFADVVCRPEGLDLPTRPDKQRPLGIQELAYLHPERYTPDRGALESHGVEVDESYFVVRCSEWDAYHDVGHRGLTPAFLRELVGYLSEHGTVYLSTEAGKAAVSTEAGKAPGLESEVPGAEAMPVPPHLVHDLLYHADLYVGDSGTMSTEAALLGTPAIRTNSIVGVDDEPVFRTLEREYGLLFSFAEPRAAMEKVQALVDDEGTARRWRRKRAGLLEDAPDVTAELLSVIGEMPNASGRPAVEPKPTGERGEFGDAR